ncbi:MAG: hypothetical protein V1738_07025 [Patescibacteria group bacterium]
MHWGVGIEVVASEIGALGRESMKTDEAELIDRLCRRCRLDACQRYQATNAINTAIELGVCRRIYEHGAPFIVIVI